MAKSALTLCLGGWKVGRRQESRGNEENRWKVISLLIFGWNEHEQKENMGSDLIYWKNGDEISSVGELIIHP